MNNYKKNDYCDEESTIAMRKNVENCSTENELSELLNKNSDYYISWKKYVNDLLEKTGLSCNSMQKITSISKNTIRKWKDLGTLPQNREVLIKLAFGLNMDLEQTNNLLTKYGRYAKLYSKDIKDAICIYVINKRVDNWDDENFSYESVIRRYELLQKEKELKRIDKNGMTLEDIDTFKVKKAILQADNDQEFEQFVMQNQSVFFNAYNSLIKYIEDFIRIRIHEVNELDDANYSMNAYFKMKGMSGEYNKMISELRKQRKLPDRNRLILLGMHLDMTYHEINKMLEYAGMRELYAKNKLESIVIYALCSINKKNPDIQLNNAFRMKEITRNPKLRKEYEKMIEQLFDAEEVPDDTEEFYNQISDYVLEVYENMKEQGVLLSEDDILRLF